MQTSFFTRKLTGKVRYDTARMVQQFSSGVHRSIFSGKGVEFQRIRPYIPSDPPMAIDDMASARLSDNPEFEPWSRVRYTKKEIPVVILVDVAECMEVPEKKSDHTAVCFWLLAHSAFYAMDRLRVVLFSKTPLHDSGWLSSEEDVDEFVKRLGRASGASPTLTRFNDVFSYLVYLKLSDALMVVVSDFCTEWSEEPELLKQLKIASNNIILLALDEWAGFKSNGYGMVLRDPRTLRTRHVSDAELKAMQAKATRHFLRMEESVRPSAIPFITLSLLDDPLVILRQKLLRLGFQ